MGRGQPGDRCRERQIAGGHRAPPPGTPLRQHPGPLRIPVRATQFQAARAAGAPGQDERADHPGGLDHPRVEMRSARRDPGSGRVHGRRVHGEAVPGRDDDQGQGRLPAAARTIGPPVRPRRDRPRLRPRPAPSRAGQIAGRPRPARSAPWARPGGRTPDESSGRHIASFPDSRRGEAPRRHVPELGAAPVEHFHPAHPRTGQHRGDGRPDPAGASYLDPHLPPGRHPAQPAARLGPDDRQRGHVGTLAAHHLGASTQHIGLRPRRSRIVEQAGLRQPVEQQPDMMFRQAEGVCLLVQQRQTARPVEQFQEASRRDVHRAERHGVRGCHTELDGVPSPPGASQCGLQHRIHDVSPE